MVLSEDSGKLHEVYLGQDMEWYIAVLFLYISYVGDVCDQRTELQTLRESANQRPIFDVFYWKAVMYGRLDFNFHYLHSDNSGILAFMP